MNKEDYVSIGQAKAMKQLGFDWKCETFWDDEGNPKEHQWVVKNFHDYPFVRNDEDCTIFRPTITQAAKWIRESKGYHIGVELEGEKWGYKIFEYDKDWRYYNLFYICDDEDDFDTYEEALSDALDMILGLMIEATKIDTNEKDN